LNLPTGSAGDYAYAAFFVAVRPCRHQHALVAGAGLRRWQERRRNRPA